MAWLASLQKLAEYKDNIIVVGFNLTQITQNKLADANVTLIPSFAQSNYRHHTLLEISQYAKNNEGIFAYWDADVYFQDSIDPIFDLAKDNFVATVNSNLGFLAGPDYLWKTISKINSLMQFTDDKRDLFICVLNYFEKFFTHVNNTWNFTDVANLSDIQGLSYKGILQKVIHPSGIIKTMLANKNILFQERHPEYNSLFKKKTFRFIALQHNINIQPEEVSIEPVS